MSLVINAEGDLLTAFFAANLYALSKKANRFDDLAFFGIGGDVPYIARTMALGARAGRLDSKKPSYWFIEPVSITQKEVERMEPIVAREIADGALLSLAFWHKMPTPFRHPYGITEISDLYRHTARVYPEESLRPALNSMSTNFVFWANILPDFQREVSILL